MARTLIIPEDGDTLDTLLLAVDADATTTLPDLVRADGETFKILLAQPADDPDQPLREILPIVDGTLLNVFIGPDDDGTSGGALASTSDWASTGDGGAQVTINLNTDRMALAFAALAAGETTLDLWLLVRVTFAGELPRTWLLAPVVVRRSVIGAGAPPVGGGGLPAATQSQVDAGTDTTTAVVPATLAGSALIASKASVAALNTEASTRAAADATLATAATNASNITTGTLATERLPATVPRSLYAEASNAVDSRLAGLTATDATVKLFSTQDDTTPAYVRSATCWVHDLDLTCISVYSTGITTSHWETGTAISPRHVLLAKHFWPSGSDTVNVPSGTPLTAPGNGATLRFVTSAGVTVTRTIVTVQQIPGFDLLIGLLDSDLPATITPAKVLPPNYAGAATLLGCPLFHTNRYQQVSVKVLSTLSGGALTLAEPPSTDAQRYAFDIPLATGDSSHPIFAVLGGQPVLLGDFHYTYGGDNLLNNVAAINAAMTTLGGGYQLTSAVLPSTALTNSAGIPAAYSPVSGQIPLLDSNGFLSPNSIPPPISQVVTATSGIVQIAGGSTQEVRLSVALTGPLTLRFPYLDATIANRTIKIIDAGGYSSQTNPVFVALKITSWGTINSGTSAVQVLAGRGTARIDADAGNNWTTDGFGERATAAQGALAATAVQPSTAPVLTLSNATGLPWSTGVTGKPTIPTTGTSAAVQKGDGAGGLAPAVAGTDYVPPDATTLHSPAAGSGFGSISGATLVMDLNPASGGFTDQQAVASLAAVNTGSITATQTTTAYRPTYLADGGMGRPALKFGGGQLLEITPAPSQHYFVVASGAFPAGTADSDFNSLLMTGHNSTLAEYAFVVAADGSWNGFGGTRYTNGVQGVYANNAAPSASTTNSVWVWEVSSTSDFPATATAALGGWFGSTNTGSPSRGWKGNIYRVLAFRNQITDNAVRGQIVAELRRLYQRPSIAFIGDSLTGGTGATARTGMYWQQALGFLNRQYTGQGYGGPGYTASQIDTLIAPTYADAQLPQVCVVWAGTNDCLSSATTGYNGLVTLLQNRKTNIPGVRTLVLTLKPSVSTAVTSYATYNVQAPVFNSLLLADARLRNGTLADGIVRVDLIPELQDPTNATYFSDGQHLTDAGYRLVARVVARAIDPTAADFATGAGIIPGGNAKLATVTRTGAEFQPGLAKSTAYTLLATDGDLEADATGAALTVTYHALAGNAGLIRQVSNVGTTNNVTVTLPAGTFTDGTTSKVITPGSSLMLKINSAGTKVIVL